MWGILETCYNIPKAIFYLLKGDYKVLSFETGNRSLPHCEQSDSHGRFK